MTRSELRELMKAARTVKALEEELERAKGLNKNWPTPEGAELERRIGERITEWAALVVKAEGEIHVLPDPDQREVLRCRYVLGWDWRRIMLHTCFHRSRVFELHRRGLEALTGS